MGYILSCVDVRSGEGVYTFIHCRGVLDMGEDDNWE